MTEKQIEEIVAAKVTAEIARIRRKRLIFWAIGFVFVPLTLWAAAIVKPNTFSDGDTLSAAKLNDNFDTIFIKLNEYLAQIEIKNGNVGIGETNPQKKLVVNGQISSSVLGTYCGKTTLTYDGLAVASYTGAKLKCETACGNVNAHLCTSHELSISTQLNITIPAGPLWYSAAFNISGYDNRDCQGWASNNGAVRGQVWNATIANDALCNISYALACCQ